MFTQINPINQSPINDSIQVLVHFKNSSFKPIRFLWNNHSYKIDTITTSYKTHDGGIYYLHFAAQSAGNLYDLTYNLANHSWRLTNITNT